MEKVEKYTLNRSGTMLKLHCLDQISNKKYSYCRPESELSFLEKVIFKDLVKQFNVVKNRRK